MKCVLCNHVHGSSKVTKIQLAHIKVNSFPLCISGPMNVYTQHMNHGSDFQSLWSQLRKEVVALQAKGYYGDGNDEVIPLLGPPS
jgi:hypothetical protein